MPIGCFPFGMRCEMLAQLEAQGLVQAAFLLVLQGLALPRLLTFKTIILMGIATLPLYAQ